jgi:putative hydrolase of the HAD superfamily
MKLVSVDFDDTLVETAPAFHDAREALFDYLETLGFDRQEAHRVHYEEVDPGLLKEHGMGPFRMAPSFRETYLHLCVAEGQAVDTSAAERCTALGRDFLGRPKVMDGSLEALRALSNAYPTIIFSQAAQKDYQLGRIRDAGVLEIVDPERVRITEEKNPDTYREALLAFGVDDPSDAVMIGNSLRSDINPALTAGSGALLVEPYEMWHYDVVPPVSDAFLRFRTFPDAVAHLLRNDGPSSP